MISILSTVIGIVFVMLLFSLLASTVMELVAGYLSLRGRQLVKAIQGMIGSDAAQDFINHPFFQQLAAGSRERTKVAGKKRALPSYINATTFSSILLDNMSIDSKTDLESKINALPDGAQKKLALFLYKQTNGELVELKKKVEDWFNEVMDRASGAYKRNSQRWLITIGLIIAVLFNADVITIYHNLSINSTLSNMVADQATVFVNSQAAPTAPNLDNPDISAAKAKIGVLVNENIAALESPLGLGWDSIDWSTVNARWWLYKVIGWLTTALGISLGATFWFEALKKLVSIRAAGPAPVAAASGPPQQQLVTASASVLSNPEPASILESTKSATKKTKT